MPLQASWVHGNALTVEQPGALASPSNHFGWGADISVLPGQSSWFHIPVSYRGLRERVVHREILNIISRF